MKVLQIITKGETGGAQSHLLELCTAMQGNVNHVVVIGGESEGTYLAHSLAALEVPVMHLRGMRNSLSPWCVVLSVRTLLRVLRAQAPDVIHAHSAIAGVIARLGGWIAGIPVAYTVHGFGFKPQAPRLHRWPAWVAEWLLAPLTSHMICVSEDERRLARGLPIARQRVSVVRNGLGDLPGAAQPQEQPLCAIMVARCAAPKRQDLLLRALALARDRLGHEIAATLVGGGPLQARLQALSDALKLSCVRFTGDVGHVPQLLLQHSVFVLLSDREGLPISVLEAMRAGLPVLASDLPGLREMVTPGEEGLLVDNEVTAIAQALIALDRDPQGRGRMGRAARQRFEAEFGAQAMARAVLAVYGQILGHGADTDH